MTVAGDQEVAAVPPDRGTSSSAPPAAEPASKGAATSAPVTQGAATTLGQATGGPATQDPSAARGSAVQAAAVRRSPLVVELAVIAFLGWIYDWLQNLAPLRLGPGLRHGQGILSFEERFHIAPEHFLDNWLTHHYVLAYISSDFYDNAIFGVTLGLAAWIWWRRPDIYRPLRNDLVLANLIGFAVFWLYPVAPPRMLPGFTDIVEKVGGLGSWHNTLISHADQLAAMPSMHLAWAVWCSLVIWRLASPGPWRRAALVFGIAYPLSTAWVVMATANHYLMDVLAGTATTVVAVAIVELGPKAVRRLKVVAFPATTGSSS
jgi:PAP2 superfamily